MQHDRLAAPSRRSQGWERHDMAIALIASALFPASLASTAIARSRKGVPHHGSLMGAAYDRARASATMAFQLPG